MWGTATSYLLMTINTFHNSHLFHSKMVNTSTLYRALTRTNLLLEPGFETGLSNSCCITFLTRISISAIGHFALLNSQYSGGTTKLSLKPLVWLLSTSPRGFSSNRLGVQLLYLHPCAIRTTFRCNFLYHRWQKLQIWFSFIRLLPSAATSCDWLTDAGPESRRVSGLSGSSAESTLLRSRSRTTFFR